MMEIGVDGTQLKDWVLPKKKKIKMKKTEIYTKKIQKEKDFLLLWSNLLVEVLYLETK